MDIDQGSRLFREKMEKIKSLANDNTLKDAIGVLAVNYFKGSFDNEGFTDKTLEPWKDVKRRDNQSKWYGHGQNSKFSLERTTTNILLGESRRLRNSIFYTPIENGVRITSPTPYGRVQQYGLTAKIYGKKSFQMTPRPFMGQSVLLMQNINKKIKEEMIKILKG